MTFLTMAEGDIIETAIQYIKPELFILAIALYFVGIGLKKMKSVSDTKIPIILGLIAIAFALIYIFATSDISGYKDVLLAIFNAIIQGILCAAAPVYASQLIIQSKKENSETK